ncbi:hypothetical protein AB0E69_33575 [Kribbella sp. NPDC026611]|uniref:hypothetical protein n=1 Tax=Kribbella sp. NPDC026611 TaxID=3154911 RepID=UPI003411BC62
MSAGGQSSLPWMVLPRLDELEADLVQRRDHAAASGWKGEVEGIDLTSTFLRSKRVQTRRSVSLGMPALRHQSR